MAEDKNKNKNKNEEEDSYPDFLKVAEEIEVENKEDPIKSRERMAEEYGKRV